MGDRQRLLLLVWRANLYAQRYMILRPDAPVGLLRRITHLTYEHYSRVISSAVADLYNGNITESAFVDKFAEIIPQQLKRAWNEGMRENGLDPETDMLEEWQTELDGVILSEFDFVDRFAAVIVDARDNPEALSGLLARGDLWANRYNDVYNLAKLLTSQGTDKFEWILGATEEHCATCEALNGIVAFSREWEQARFRPQEPPNEMLECGGWRCDCVMEPTDKRRTPNALNKLLHIMIRKSI